MARNRDTSIKSKITTLSTSLVLSCLASQVYASGFAILEQNVTNLGLAYSGTAALAEDASTGYFNPAGLTELGESEMVLSGVLIQGDFDFTASRATASFPLAPAAPIVLTGPSKEHPGTVTPVPTFYVSKRLDDRWVFSVAINSPFGLNTQYQENGIARYLATKSQLQTVNFSPNIGYELLPCFSLGFGVDAMWGKAALDTQIGTGNSSLDGFQKNRLHGWGYSWHAGLMWKICDTTRVGLTYRSHVNLRAEGNSENLVPIGLPGAGTYVIERVRSEIVVPETWTLSLYHEFYDQWAVTVDAAWTDWSRFRTLRLRYEPGFGTGLDTDAFEHYKDSRRIALGFIYTYDPNWKFRIGTAYDQSPVRNEFREPRVPDSNRWWLAAGAAYIVNEAVQLDVGYAHLFFKHSSIDQTVPFIALTETPINAATLAGSYKGNANLFGVQIRYNFV